MSSAADQRREEGRAIDANWDFADPAGSERRFRAAIAELEPVDHPLRLALLTQIARAQGLQRRFDDAHRTLDEVEALTGDSGPRIRVRVLLERGRVERSAGDGPGSFPLFVGAWHLAREAEEEELAVDAAHMAAIVAPADEQMEWHGKAVDHAESSTDPRARRWLGSLLNNIGWTHHDKGEFDEALDIFRRALAFREEQGDAGPIRIARWSVARATRSLGRLEEALAIQDELRRELDAAGEVDGFVLEETAECLHALGRAGEAREYFARAHAELSKDAWLQENEPARLRRLLELSRDEGAPE